ncbi:MAG TPA: hypothetical protein EYP40_03600 [Chromatiales bacterium]|nr:hypothetical protein [Chromatiales bacterium]
MKKTLSILLLGALPFLAIAGGAHLGGHDKEHQQHVSHDNKDMGHDGHAADAGRPGDPARVSRVIEVNMDDTMRFTPNQLEFKAGETVRFVVRNHGKIRHEMVLGTMDDLKSHMQMMRNNPTMQHTDPNMISLAPGEQGDLVWQFDKPGRFDFACLVPGHLEAGMTGKITIK